jgi:hypothetical protein
MLLQYRWAATCSQIYARSVIAPLLTAGSSPTYLLSSRPIRSSPSPTHTPSTTEAKQPVATGATVSIFRDCAYFTRDLSEVVRTHDDQLSTPHALSRMQPPSTLPQHPKSSSLKQQQHDGQPPTSQKSVPVITSEPLWQEMTLAQRLQYAMLNEDEQDPLLALHRGYAYLCYGEECQGEAALGFSQAAEWSDHPETRELHARCKSRWLEYQRHAANNTLPSITFQFDPESDAPWVEE